MTLFDVEHVLQQLTIEEKVGLTSGLDFWHLKGIERLGVPSLMVTDGPHGLRKQDGSGDHIGIGNSVPATCFPPAVTLASAWNLELAEKVGSALGVETRANVVSVLLGPGVNIKRSPLCGRNFEYFSEDPLLSGLLGAAWIRGVQSHGVGTSLKHYAANNQEHRRMTVNALIDDRALHEIYLASFEHAVKGGKPATLMCAYNGINGTTASENHWLLTEVLRNRWGWEGVVMSDWGATYRRVPSISAGLDLEMPAAADTDQQVVDAYKANELDLAVIDTAARRVLQLISNIAPNLPETVQEFPVDEHHHLAYLAALEGSVLLKNDPVDGTPLLPLANSDQVAIIGEFARTPRYQGAGSSQVVPTKLVSALDALEERGITTSFAAGFSIEANADAAVDQGLRDEAVAIAAKADKVAVFLGLPAHLESEGYDRETLALPQNQLELLAAVAQANANVVVVLANGGVVTVTEWEQQAPAILEGFLGGQAGAEAIVDLLWGKANPSGHLAETVPVRIEDTSSFGNFPGEIDKVHYSESIFVGYRWFDSRKLAVAYPFGHGLSYTSFEYGSASVEVADSAVPHAVVRVTVKNTGERAGGHVVQAYVTSEAPSLVRPAQELKGFTKVFLEPGESADVAIELDARAFSYWHPSLQDWAIDGGEYRVAVGASSRDLRTSTAFTLDIAAPAIPLGDNPTFGDVMNHPVGGERIAEILASNSKMGGREIPTMFLRMLADMPLSVLSRMTILDLPNGEIEKVVADIRAAS